jgi:hypothetical protein
VLLPLPAAHGAEGAAAPPPPPAPRASDGGGEIATAEALWERSFPWRAAPPSATISLRFAPLFAGVRSSGGASAEGAGRDGAPPLK